MPDFDKQQAISVIEDALTELGSPNGRGMATGLCGAFYMCGLITSEEWQAYLGRIPVEYPSNGESENKCADIA